MRSLATIRRTTDDRGAVFVFAILILVVVLLASGLAIDLGRQRFARRDAQALADVVALDMSRLADGRTLSEINTNGEGRTALDQSIERNGHAGQISQETVGKYVFTATTGDRVVTLEWGWFSEQKNHLNCQDSSADGFVDQSPTGSGWFCAFSAHVDPNGIVGALGNQTPNAARATSTDKVSFLLLPAGGGPSSGGVNRSAVASYRDTTLGYSKVGSSMANVNSPNLLPDNPILDAFLKSLVPDVSILSYEGLAAAHFDRNVALRHLGIDTTTASPEELENASVTYGEFFEAMAVALEENEEYTAAASMRLISEEAKTYEHQFQPRYLNPVPALSVGTGQGSPAGTIDLNSMQILASSTALVNGENFVISGSSLGIPGIGDVAIGLTGVEAPKIIGPYHEDSETTAQATLSITPQIAIQGDFVESLCSLPPEEQSKLEQLFSNLIITTACLVDPILGIILNPVEKVVNLSITASPTITASAAEVTVTQYLDCANREITMDPDPSLLTLEVADLDLVVSAAFAFEGFPRLSEPTIGQLHWGQGISTSGTGDPATFRAQEPGTPTGAGVRYERFDPPTTRRGSDPLGLSDLFALNQPTIQVNDTTLRHHGTRIIQVAENQLNQKLEQLDLLLVQPLAEMLGLTLGGSDLTPLSLTCGDAQLMLVG